MSNIIFVGDVHLKGSSPISRKDDYPEVILNKIKYIADYAEEIGCKHILFLGDIFDTVNTSLQYFSYALSVFKNIRDRGIGLYTIVGNHDIRYESLDSLPTTPLGILVKSNIISLLDTLEVDDVRIVGCHYSKDPEQNKYTNNYSILLLHKFYEAGFGEVPLTREDTINLGYDTYILGHDHKPYSTQVIRDGLKTIQIYRTGSLARNSSDQYNRIRVPRFLVFNTDDKSYEYVNVQAESGFDIFFEQQAEQETISMKELVDYLKSSYHTSDSTLRDYINEAPIPDDVRQLIDTYLNILGA